MAPRLRTPRSLWDFGRKVARLLDDNKAAGRGPKNAAELERTKPLDLGSGTVRKWIDFGRSPRAKTAREVARIFGVDPGWLTDDSQAYPPPKAARSLDVMAI